VSKLSYAYHSLPRQRQAAKNWKLWNFLVFKNIWIQICFCAFGGTYIYGSLLGLPHMVWYCQIRRK